MKTQLQLAAMLLLLGCRGPGCSAQKLQEPMVNNLEQAAVLEASATCGVGPDGSSIVEEFCRITGGIKHESESGIEVKEGSQCGRCNAFSHPASHVKSSYLGDSLSWMSPPLIRGDEFENVNFTISFKKFYQIDNIVMKTGESPRPAAFAVLKSLDGVNYQPLIYFSTDCRLDFRMEPKILADADDEVICMERYKELQQFKDHSADIHILLNKNRPSGQQPSERLLEFLRVKSVRINFRRLYKFSNSMTPLNERKDDNQKKRYFYSVSLLKISGHCYCNGLASACELDSLVDDFKCTCIRGVEGDTCNRCMGNVAPPTCSGCKPGFFNLDPANPEGCTACFCNGLPNVTCSEAGARMMTQSVKRLIQPLPPGSSVPSQQLNDVLFSPLDRAGSFPGSANLLLPVEQLTNETARLYLGSLWVAMRLEFDGAPAVAEIDSFLTLWSNEGSSLRYRIVQAGQPIRKELAFQLLLHENSFTSSDGSEMTRLQLLSFLARMRRISWPIAVVGNVTAVRLQDASLELAELSNSPSAIAGRPVRGVERCACPKEYSGLSCQLLMQQPV